MLRSEHYVVQVLNAMWPSDFWLQAAASQGLPGFRSKPHGLALLNALTPVDMFVGLL
jgi:hypothetical protein